MRSLFLDADEIIKALDLLDKVELIVLEVFAQTYYIRNRVCFIYQSENYYITGSNGKLPLLLTYHILKSAGFEVLV